MSVCVHACVCVCVCACVRVCFGTESSSSFQFSGLTLDVFYSAHVVNFSGRLAVCIKQNHLVHFNSLESHLGELMSYYGDVPLHHLFNIGP